MRLVGLLGAAAATLMAQAVAPGWAAVHLPTDWAYTLDTACRWHPRPWVLALGPSVRPRPDAAAEASETRCWRSHGARSTTPFLKPLLGTWPTADQFARWDTEDEAALHAPHAGQD